MVEGAVCAGCGISLSLPAFIILAIMGVIIVVAIVVCVACGGRMRVRAGRGGIEVEGEA